MNANSAGLKTMLEQLGVKRHPWLAGVFIIAVFEVTIIGLATLQAWLEYIFAWRPIIVFVLFWVVWTFWHSWLFPRNRLRYLAGSKHPYLRAFIFDIYPWVSAGFSQMWRPLLNGDTLNGLLHGRLRLHLAPVLLGMLVCVSSLVIIIQAIRTIGIHNAAFLREFVDCQSFVPIRQGVYRVVMHPLFWSGIAYSCGLAIMVTNLTAYEIAGVNILYGVAYRWLEDRRLGKIFGANYEDYRRGFGGSSLDARDGKVSRSRPV